MIAKYPRTCHVCRKPIEVGKDEYDIERKVSFHWSCEENQPPGPEAYRLADKLGFVGPGEAVRADWKVWDLRQANRSETAGRPGAAPLRGQNGSLFGD